MDAIKCNCLYIRVQASQSSVGMHRQWQNATQKPQWQLSEEQLHIHHCYLQPSGSEFAGTEQLSLYTLQ